MGTADERFTMPDGSAYVVRRPTAATDGAFVEMEFVLPAGCAPPPPHVHPHGSRTTRCSASVPVGALHTFKNRSGQTVRVRNWHRLAMRFEEFIQRTSRTLQAAGVRRKHDPRVALYVSMVMLDFEETLCPARARERLPMQALAAIARRLPAPAR